jgi:phosphoglycerate dehydrogenase-like enzyme
MMLALVRRLPLHFRDKQERVFRRAHPYGEVAGSTACIVGLGDIGMAVAKICKALGMHVLGVVRNSNRQYVHTDKVYSISSLKEALEVADHVFVTVTGEEENRNLFSYEVLLCLRPDAYFYNVSRGMTVDESALSELLATGRIAGAGIDVTDIEPLPPASPLWSLGDNVLITGHSAGFSKSQPERFCQLVIRNLLNLHENKQLENQVI